MVTSTDIDIGDAATHSRARASSVFRGRKRRSVSSAATPAAASSRASMQSEDDLRPMSRSLPRRSLSQSMSSNSPSLCPLTRIKMKNDKGSSGSAASSSFDSDSSSSPSLSHVTAPKRALPPLPPAISDQERINDFDTIRMTFSGGNEVRVCSVCVFYFTQHTVWSETLDGLTASLPHVTAPEWALAPLPRTNK